ncbi:hypothetical protein [uncultured Dialister sp.]|uniref:hypothetical protein n=1 Tax=uncultured Dialister sp. TaxID=278064 RepID=UPI0026E02D82|nr:hypothetical protein [uncultured Dialister sp.]
MKNQVTSIEQSKRLIELGVPAERASMVWEMDEDCARLKIWNTDKETRRVLHNKYPNYYVPAFTVADLLAVLPKTLWGDQKGWIHLIIRFPNEDHCKIVYDNSYNILWKCDGSLLSCIVETIGWVITNGYRLNP